MLSSFIRGRVCTNEGGSCQHVVSMKPTHRNSSRWSKDPSSAIAGTPARGAYSPALFATFSSSAGRGAQALRGDSGAIGPRPCRILHEPAARHREQSAIAP
jgi:hypothetical protein